MPERERNQNIWREQREFFRVKIEVMAKIA
jgi:hypothetical protein